MASSAIGALAATAVLPAGSMVDYAGTSAPGGWLMCDGSAVSRSTYSQLFAAIGTTYGAGVFAPALDTGFTVGTGFDGPVYGVFLQTDGKILVGGNFTSYNGTTRNRIARLNSDGTLDTGFTVGTGFDNSVYDVFLQTDGKVLVGGSFTSYNGTTRNRIARLNSNGTLDTGFTVGTGFDGSTEVVVAQTDGKILVGGNFTSYNGTTRNRIARLNSDGTLDTGFTVGTGFNSSVLSIAVQTDGKILVGGSFTSYNGTTRNRRARLNSDGTIDNSFTVGAGFNDSVWYIAVQTDGKILVGGNFTSYNGVTTNGIARLNSDGTIDNSFTVGTGFNSSVLSIAVQTDGKILVGGNFTSYNGTTRNRIARLNSDGTLDTGFTVGTGFDNNTVFSIAVQTDGKILVGGTFTSYNGTAINRIARLDFVSTTFNLPDYRGRFARYMDNMGTGTGAAGRDSGRTLGAAQTQATAKNGLQNNNSTVIGTVTAGSTSVSIDKTKWNTNTGGMSQNENHSHPITANNDERFTSNTLVYSGTGDQATINTGIVSTAHTHAITYTGSETFTVPAPAVSHSLTAPAQTIAGDAETRPINLSCNRIIKF